MQTRRPHKPRQETKKLLAYLLANATMTAGTERLVWAVGALANSAESEINFFTRLIGVLVQSLRRKASVVGPTGVVELERPVPNSGVGLAHRGRSKHVVTLGDDIGTVLRWCRERLRYGHIVADVAEDRVDRRVNTKSLANDGVEERKVLGLIVGDRVPRSVGAAEVLDLFSEELLSAENNE